MVGDEFLNVFRTAIKIGGDQFFINLWRTADEIVAAFLS